MNQLTKIFENQNLTIIEQNEQSHFKLNDVCKILGLAPRVVRQRLSDDVCSTYPILDSLGRTQQVTFVNEDGLYDVILDSRKPEAKRFRKWITSEVLPSIRKHGAYATPQTIENIISDPDFGIKLLTNLKDERDKRMEAERVIEQQKPKVVFAESCLVSQDTVLVKDVAKLACNQGIMIGQNKLYNKLRDWGYIQKNNTQPTQRALEAGYFQILQRTIHSPEGEPKLTRTTKVTPKGQLRILNRLRNEIEQEAI
ncbi:phage antirepressor [Cytobacillus horneckiae]|uniref:Phage antirepressor Ant n=1 Tax=Cytobacillus horneckiae TaxID=549687 RepID=A0A2N0ZH03_9BACI|nr:phage antirepressor [Cytobacillus horneckiae]MED2940691.1 phage antirepressor [Cytobacillus horneckiae]PKG28778.1 phage antirepressor Ant [Cytobacillus horneckiae]